MFFIYILFFIIMTHSEFQKSSFVKAECNKTYVQLVKKNVENKVRGPVKGIDLRFIW
jgi:hypothetical protein